MKIYFWDGSGFTCPVCGGGSGHCANPFTRTRLSHYLRALWMTLRIMEWPWSKLRDEYDYTIKPALAWEIATDLWLGKNAKN